MASSDNEAWYDAEIAPVLMGLARKCEARGMAFIAVVEYGQEPSARGRTAVIPPAAGPENGIPYDSSMVMKRYG